MKNVGLLTVVTLRVYGSLNSGFFTLWFIGPGSMRIHEDSEKDMTQKQHQLVLGLVWAVWGFSSIKHHPIEISVF